MWSDKCIYCDISRVCSESGLLQSRFTCTMQLLCCYNGSTQEELGCIKGTNILFYSWVERGFKICTLWICAEWITKPLRFQ